VAGTSGVNDHWYAGRRSLEGDVAKGLDSRGEEKDVRRCVQLREVVGIDPSHARCAGKALQFFKCRSGTGHDGTEVGTRGMEAPYNLGEDVRTFLRYKTTYEED